MEKILLARNSWNCSFSYFKIMVGAVADEHCLQTVACAEQQTSEKRISRFCWNHVDLHISTCWTRIWRKWFFQGQSYENPGFQQCFKIIMFCVCFQVWALFGFFFGFLRSERSPPGYKFWVCFQVCVLSLSNLPTFVLAKNLLSNFFEIMKLIDFFGFYYKNRVVDNFQYHFSNHRIKHMYAISRKSEIWALRKFIRWKVIKTVKKSTNE